MLSISSQNKNISKKLDYLIKETAQENKSAFKELYELTQRSVYAFALSILKNAYDSQDAMHDTYLSIYSSSRLYSSRNKPMAWILTICKNHCYKKINERKRTCQINENVIFTEEQLSLINSDDKFLIQKCLLSLKDEERQIVVLHSVAGFKHREIAELLGLKLSTVLSKYNRSIKKLKELLINEGENYEK